MEGIEKLWWAKHRIEEQTEGKQRLIIGAGGHLFVKVDDSCLAACYFAMVRNQKTGQYHADVKGYLRTFSGYCNGTRLEQLSEEISGLAALVKELELARHNLPPLEFEELRSLLLERAAPGDVQRAAAFYKVIRYSYGSGCTSFGCQPFDVRKTFHLIWQAADRLANTVIENKDFEALIRQYDRENAFLYCDPPYFMTEDHYEVEFPRQDHVRLRETLAGCQGKWMVSYNDCDYIRGLYEGCHITAVSRINNLAQRYDRGCEFPEVIITNYDPQERKKWGPQQMDLFSAGLLGGETEDGGD